MPRSVAFELLRLHLVTIDGFLAAKRFAVGFVLICVLWSLAGNLVGFTTLVVNGARTSRAVVEAQKTTLSPHELELQLLDRNVFGLVRKPRADLRCEPRTGAWTFVCSVLPTPTTSSERVQFGVVVDHHRTIYEISRLTPVGTALPSPEKILIIR
jgi:hypothetical protein